MEKDFCIGKAKIDRGLLKIIKGILLSFFITMVLLFLYAAVLVYTDVNESTIKPVVTIITALSIMLGGFISSMRIKKRGIINGMLVGLVYSLVNYFFSSITLVGFEFNTNSIILILLSIFAGGIGGIIGVNFG